MTIILLAIAGFVILIGIGALLEQRGGAPGSFGWHSGMTPRGFEQRCASYLRERGWRASTTKGSGDQGVDVLAEKAGIRVVLQCKQYSKPVGNRAVQEAHAGRGYAKARAAAVVTNNGYTPAARDLAKRLGVHLLHYNDLARADALFGVPVGLISGTRVVRPCNQCSTNLRLPPGRSGMVRCPKCGARSRQYT